MVASASRRKLPCCTVWAEVAPEAARRGIRSRDSALQIRNESSPPAGASWEEQARHRTRSRRARSFLLSGHTQSTASRSARWGQVEEFVEATRAQSAASQTRRLWGRSVAQQRRWRAGEGWRIGAMDGVERRRMRKPFNRRVGLLFELSCFPLAIPSRTNGPAIEASPMTRCSLLQRSQRWDHAKLRPPLPQSGPARASRRVKLCCSQPPDSAAPRPVSREQDHECSILLEGAGLRLVPARALRDRSTTWDDPSFPVWVGFLAFR